MAIWQFDVHLLPRQVSRQMHGDAEKLLRLYEEEDGDPWQALWSFGVLSKDFDGVAHKGGYDWSAKVSSWGEEGGDRIDCFHDGDRVYDVSVRFNCLKLSISFVEKIINLCLLRDLVILDADMREIAGSATSLYNAIISSKRYLLANNPSLIGIIRDI